MATELQKNWELALAYIKRNVQETSYDMWIAPLKPRSYNEETGAFVLVLPDGVAKNIMDRYEDVVAKALKKVYDKKVVPLFLEADQVGHRSTSSNPQKNSIFSDEFYLNPRYIFTSFVVGPGNQFAWSAAQAVASMPGKSYNPLFLYGGSGLGKTHLMHAIGHAVQKMPRRKVLYVSSEMFTNELMRAIQERKQEDFRAKYRKVDVLLVDDIQFIAGKESTETEFFNTFEELYNAGKQIVLTSDRKPDEITGLQERLVTRFEWGLMADIQPPEFETRVAILQKKAEQENISVTPELSEVCVMVAERIHANIRELEGAFNRIIAYSSLTGQPINKATAKEALRDFFSEESITVTPAAIKKAVAKYYGVKLSDLDSEVRARSIAYPRQVAMYLCKELTDISYPALGKLFGGKDHTTVLYAYNKIAKDRKTQASLQNDIEKISASLQE